MIVEKAVQKIERTGIGEEVKFGMKVEDAPYIFSILRNDLYSDKIMAVIREYSTNAIDAHVEAGVTRPVEITVPTQFSRNYSIRDFGNGLSEEDIVDIFTKYGASTKRESNAFNGMLGLGSKSAFAYNPEFQVISRYKGTQYTWLAHIDESDIGVITCIDKKPTKESGLSIHISVNPNDVKSFEDKLFHFFRDLDYLPIFSNPEIKNKIEEYKKNRNVIISGIDWDVENLNTHPNLFVHMGNVSYPVSMYEVIQEMGRKNMIPEKFLQKQFYSNNFYTAFSYGTWNLFAPIGSVSFTPNRESLQINDKTKGYLFQKLLSILHEINDKAMEKLNSTSSLWEKKCVANDLVNNLKFPIPQFKLYAEDFNEKELKDLGVASVRKDHYQLRLYDTTILPCNRNAIYFLDGPDVLRSQFKERIRKYCLDNNIEIKSNAYQRVAHNLFVLYFSSKEKKNEFKNDSRLIGAKMVDIADIEYVSSKKSTTAGRKGEVGEVYRFHSEHRLNFDKWKSLDKSPESAIWVEISSFMPKHYGNNNDLTTLERCLNVDLKCVRTIYGVKTANKKEVPSDWKEIKVHFQEQIDRFKEEEADVFVAYCKYSKLNQFWHEFISPTYRGKCENYYEPFEPVYEEYKLFTKHKNRLESIQHSCDKLSIKFYEEMEVEQITRLITDIPILSCFHTPHVQYESLHKRIGELL